MTARIALTAVSAAMGLLLAASGATEDKVTRIGLLTRMSPIPSLTEAFGQGLRELGYVEGKSIVVVTRNSISSDEELPALAAELVNSKVDVIVTVGTPATRATLAATKTIPVVFAAVGDPQGAGLVESLARPGGNATGVSMLNTELNSKRLDLLHQLAPSARHVVIVTDYGNPSVTVGIGPLQALAKTLGIKLEALDVRNPRGVDSALRSAAWKSADAVQVGGSVFFIGQGAKIAQDVRASKRPAIFPYREYHDFGVLMFVRCGPQGCLPPRCILRRQDSQRRQAVRAAR